MNHTNTTGFNKFFGRGLYRAGPYQLPLEDVPYTWVYRSAAQSLTAGQSSGITWDAYVNDDLGAYSNSVRVTAPVKGLYLACLTVSGYSATTPNEFWAQINCSEVSNTLAEEHHYCAGASAGAPSVLTMCIIYRLSAGSYFNTYWGNTTAFTGVTGQYNTAMWVYKIG